MIPPGHANALISSELRIPNKKGRSVLDVLEEIDLPSKFN
jgi:hypothetical protein